MKMNKKFALMALAVLATAPVMVSCDDDDDDNKNGYDKETLITEFDLDLDDDVLELCDVDVVVTDFDGNTRTVSMTLPDWKEKLSTTSFPATCTYSVNITRKPDVTLTKATYDLDAEISFEADSYIGSKKTTVLPETDITLSAAENVPADQLHTQLNRLIATASFSRIDYTFTVNDAGQITATQNFHNGD